VLEVKVTPGFKILKKLDPEEWFGINVFTPFLKAYEIMVNFFSYFILIGLSLLFSPPSVLHGAEYQFGIEIIENYLSQTHYLDQYLNRFSYDQSSNLIAVGPNLLFKPSREISGYFRGYIYWDYLFEDNYTEVEGIDTYFSDAYMEYKNRKWFVRLGLQPMKFGNGLIFLDDVIAASIYHKQGSFYWNIYGAKVMDKSPIVGGSMGYQLGLFQQIETFILYYEDRENAFSQTLGQILAENDLTNEGYLSWFGLSSELFIGDVYLTLVGVYQTGQMDFVYLKRPLKRELSAYLFDIGSEINITNRFSMGLFCFFASGDKQPPWDDFSAFISPLPYNSRASIFFDPDFIGLDETSSLIFGGVTPYGVIAPGLNLTLEPLRDLLIKSQVTLLYPHYKPSEEKSWYGWELDLEISYRFNDKTIIYMEIERFEHGDFFKTTSELEPSAAVRLTIGGQMQFFYP